jgi:hypothetical protein
VILSLPLLFLLSGPAPASRLAEPVHDFAAMPYLRARALEGRRARFRIVLYSSPWCKERVYFFLRFRLPFLARWGIFGAGTGCQVIDAKTGVASRWLDDLASSTWGMMKFHQNTSRQERASPQDRKRLDTSSVHPPGPNAEDQLLGRLE